MTKEDIKRAVIIVASGEGIRFGGAKPKQFLNIKDKMVLEHTLDSFLGRVDKVILVVSSSYLLFCANHFADNDKIHCCEGGDSRQESVYKGLIYLNRFSPKLVAIHDGVRMLVKAEQIEESFKTAEVFGSAIPIIPMTDSLWSRDLSLRYDRGDFVSSQTPQTFIYDKILNAHKNVVGMFKDYSDCAGIYLSMYNDLHSYDGDKGNIKLTTSDDKDYIEYILSKKS